MFINLDKWGISTFTLKIIAMITMIIDHVGFLFFQDNHQTYIILRSIGRISFPIFCFVLVEGFFYFLVFPFIAFSYLAIKTTMLLGGT